MTPAAPLPVPLLSGLSAERIAAIGEARRDLLQVIAAMNKERVHPVRDVIASGPQPFTRYQHYPPDDVDDVRAGYAWYYHAHEPSEVREWEEHGHFHCYAYPALLAGAVPLARPPEGDAASDAGMTHLVALCCSNRGAPNRLVTVNRWVTNEWMYRADDVLPLIDRFVIAPDLPFPLVGRWLSAMLRVLSPQVTWLLHERDRVLDLARARDPQGYSEDRSLEIVSSISFDLDAHLLAIAG